MVLEYIVLKKLNNMKVNMTMMGFTFLKMEISSIRMDITLMKMDWTRLEDFIVMKPMSMYNQASMKIKGMKIIMKNWQDLIQKRMMRKIQNKDITIKKLMSIISQKMKLIVA